MIRFDTQYSTFQLFWSFQTVFSLNGKRTSRITYDQDGIKAKIT